MRAGLWLLSALWIVWCAGHSLLAAISARRAIKARLGGLERWYRLGYNLFAALTVAPVMALEKWWAAAPPAGWGDWEWLRMALFWGAVAAFIWVMRAYEWGTFSGLSGDDADGAADTAGLKTDGPLAYSRHPLYALGFVLLWTRPLADTSIVTSVLLTAYLVIGAWLEERKLVIRFGAAYEDYRRRTPMFFPWPKRG